MTVNGQILEKSDYIMISGSPYIKKSGNILEPMDVYRCTYWTRNLLIWVLSVLPGWRKISCFFSISFEIRDKSIEFDENRNVQRAEFVARALMQYVLVIILLVVLQNFFLKLPFFGVPHLWCYLGLFARGGRFSDGWGSCERREKRFLKPNHDIPSTAETRAKNKACQVSVPWFFFPCPNYAFIKLCHGWGPLFYDQNCFSFTL